jgi:hypothetical protein
MLVQHGIAHSQVNLNGWERPPLFAGSPYLNKVSDTRSVATCRVAHRYG